MQFAATYLTLILASASLNAAEPAAKPQVVAATSLQVDQPIPDQFVFQIKIIEGNLQKKETHKVLCEPVTVTVKNRPSKFNSGGEVKLPHVPGKEKYVEYVPHGVNIQITPIALDDDTVRLDLQLQKINLVTSNDKEYESETSGRRWNKTVKLGKSNLFVLDKSTEKQTWLEITVLVNRVE